MSPKSMILAVLILVALTWLFLFGPNSCEFLSGIRYNELAAEMLPWLKENIKANWVPDNPDIQTITVDKVSILKLSATAEKQVKEAQVKIKGYYNTHQSEQKVKFEISRKIIVESNAGSNTFRLAD